MAVLNDEQVMLRDMAREWADNESPVAAFRRLRNAATGAGYDPDAWNSVGQMGWAGVVVPEEYGGSAFGYLSLGLVIEQLGRNLAATPLASTGPAATAIAMGGDEGAKAEWLPRIADGSVVATLAIDEGPVHGGADYATGVENGRLSGTKAFVAEGDEADTVVASVSYQLRTGVSIETLAAQNRGGTEALVLTGNEVSQIVAGNDGANTLDGRGGADTLVGGGGADVFAFTTAAASGSGDTILDFQAEIDKIGLATDVFAAVTAGGIQSGEFVLGTVAQDADDRLVYDQATGRLFYDADGNGSGAAVLLAQLAVGTLLAANDFVTVAPVADVA